MIIENEIRKVRDEFVEVMGIDKHDTICECHNDADVYALLTDLTERIIDEVKRQQEGSK